MKIIYLKFTVVLLSFLSIKYMMAQVSVVDYIDTNVVDKYSTKNSINYELNRYAVEGGEWKYKTENGIKKSVLYFLNYEDFIILRFSTYEDSCIIEKKYFPSGSLKSKISFASFISYDTIEELHDEFALPQVFINEFKVKNGYYLLYHENGKLKELGNYYSNGREAKELKTGEWKEL